MSQSSTFIQKKLREACNFGTQGRPCTSTKTKCVVCLSFFAVSQAVGVSRSLRPPSSFDGRSSQPTGTQDHPQCVVRASHSSFGLLPPSLSWSADPSRRESDLVSRCASPCHSRASNFLELSSRCVLNSFFLVRHSSLQKKKRPLYFVCSPHPLRGIHHLRHWCSRNNHVKELNRIDGMQTEVEWKIFTRFTTLDILEKIKKFDGRYTVCTSAVQWQNHLRVNVQRHCMERKRKHREVCSEFYYSCEVRSPRGRWSFFGTWIRKVKCTGPILINQTEIGKELQK